MFTPRATVLAVVAGGLLLSVGSAGAQEKPSFRADRVLSAGDVRKTPLIPGTLISIYGEHLGPLAGCVGQIDPNRRETASPLLQDVTLLKLAIYPSSLCETQVLIDGQAAGLLYVSDSQINFKVPMNRPVEGVADLRVVYEGRQSDAVRLQAGDDTPTVVLDQPAYAGMPVWLKVESVSPGAIRYPFGLVPAGFGCDAVEVRRHGHFLKPYMEETSPRFGGQVFAGNPCGSLGLPSQTDKQGRLPLHLQYRFDEPGTYEVRFSRSKGMLTKTGRAPVREQSPWTKIEILPAELHQRAKWLEGLRQRNPQDVTELLTDVLPSVLGGRDAASLEFVADYLYHPDDLVRRYAANGLGYWPDAWTRSKVQKLLFARGPSDALINWLAWGHHSDPSSAEAVVQAALPWLDSALPIAVGGAIMAVNSFAGAERPGAERQPFSETFRQEIGAAMLRAVESVVKLVDAQTMIYFVTALAAVKTEQTHALLWTFVDRQIAVEQTVICLSWFADTRDLARLGGMLLEADSARNLWNLPYALHRAFGEAAVPYLEEGEKSASREIREACTRELRAGKMGL